MQVTIFGASGRVGREIVNQLLAETEYNLVLLVHNSSPFRDNPRLKIVRGDIHSRNDVAKAIQGSDVVISALGSWGTKTKDILSSAAANIIPVMEEKRIKRLISLTGSDARASGDHMSILNGLSHLAIKCSPLRQILIDGENHIKLLEASDLDWTVIRSPVMVKGTKRGGFDLSLDRPMPWQTVQRKFVVTSIVDQIKQRNYIRKAPFIKSS
jgi:putative NADH-flavin reductase